MKNINTHSSWIVGIGLMLGCSFSTGSFAQESDYLNVYTVGGTNDLSVLLNDIHKITFDDSQVTVWYTEGEMQSMPYATLWKVTFGKSLSSIDEVESSADCQIIYNSFDQRLEIMAASPIESFAIYNMQGRLMLQASPRTEAISVALRDYPTGVYIVRVGDGKTLKTQKIIKH